MDAIYEKVKGVVVVNGEIIDAVEKSLAQVDAQVVAGFSFSLDLKAEFKDGKSVGEPWKLVAKPFHRDVNSLVRGFEYDGEKLKDFEDIFNDSVDLTLVSYDDAKRLQEDLPRVASKWVRIARDTPDNQEQLSLLLHNMGTVTGALGMVQALTIDAQNPLEGQSREVIDRGMEDVTRGWGAVLGEIHGVGGVEGCTGGLEMTAAGSDQGSAFTGKLRREGTRKSFGSVRCWSGHQKAEWLDGRAS
jgi:hypothetical protein